MKSVWSRLGSLVVPLLGRRYRRRWILEHHPLSDELWRKALRKVPIARRLRPSDRERLRELVTLFLHEKTFEGARGLRVTETMRLVIGVQACLLILNLGLDAYDGWKSIIVYPDEFVNPIETPDEHGLVPAERPTHAGEAWLAGPVILSWRDAREGSLEDGVNVVIHEFAHKLDMLDGEANGAPPLHEGMDREAWKRDFSSAYESFCRRVDAGEETYIDPYAAESPAEFFAVLSEAFFETPEDVVDEFPELYEHLRAFYRQDPLE